MEYGVKFYLAILPILLINVSLVIWSVMDWIKRKNFKMMSKNVWLVLIFCVQIIGPVLYLLVGRDLDND